MTEAHFWDIVSRACRSDSTGEWARSLQGELEKLEPAEIIEWNHTFDRLVAKAYTIDMWGAAYLINGGASDDGFYYFRCWLVGAGRDVYETAIANPDNLAEFMAPGVDAEAEIYAAAHQAWMTVTGRPDTDPYPARNEKAELQGEDWDFNDDDEVRQHLPRLAVKYLA